jgi:hypothetical protein
MSKFVSVQQLPGGYVVDSDIHENGAQIVTSLSKVMRLVKALLETSQEVENDEIEKH